MSSPLESNAVPEFRGLHRVGLGMLRKRAGWCIGVGLLWIVFGALAIGYDVTTTLVVSAFVGALLALGGAVQTVHAFMMREWGGFLLLLATGVLNLVIGALMFANPDDAAQVLTMLITAFLFVGGCFRIAAGLATEFHHRTWTIVSGVISLLLAFSIMSNWPYSALQVIGIFVGIDMIFDGVSLLMLGLAAKKVIDLPA